MLVSLAPRRFSFRPETQVTWIQRLSWHLRLAVPVHAFKPIVVSRLAIADPKKGT